MPAVTAAGSIPKDGLGRTRTSIAMHGGWAMSYRYRLLPVAWLKPENMGSRDQSAMSGDTIWYKHNMYMYMCIYIYIMYHTSIIFFPDGILWSSANHGLRFIFMLNISKGPEWSIEPIRL